MQSIWQLINQGWFSTLIGVIGIVIGVVASYRLYQLSLRDPRLAYVKITFDLFGAHSVLPTGFEVTFKRKSVPQVTKTIITLWNYGRGVVNEDDIVSTDPLRIVTANGSEILEVEILEVTRQATGFKILRQPNEINIARIVFDFIDYDDGVAISILHTSKKPAVLEGTIKRIPEGVKDFGKLPRSRMAPSDYIPEVLSLLMGIFSVWSTVKALSVFMNPSFSNLVQEHGIPIILGLVSVIFISIRSVWDTSIKFVNQMRQPPKKLFIRDIGY